MHKTHDPSHGTVTLPGVTNQHDLLLRELWLAYAMALGPFDVVGPDIWQDTPRPNLGPEMVAAIHALRAIRSAIRLTQDRTQLSEAIRLWLLAVDSAQGFNGCRQAFVRSTARSTGLRTALFAAEALLRARVDDALICLENREYTECYTHVLNDFRLMFSPTEFASLKAHATELVSTMG